MTEERILTREQIEAAMRQEYARFGVVDINVVSAERAAPYQYIVVLQGVSVVSIRPSLARRKLAAAALKWIQDEFYADDHPEQPEGEWSAETSEGELDKAARELVAALDEAI